MQKQLILFFYVTCRGGQVRLPEEILTGIFKIKES